MTYAVWRHVDDDDHDWCHATVDDDTCGRCDTLPRRSLLVWTRKQLDTSPTGCKLITSLSWLDLIVIRKHSIKRLQVLSETNLTSCSCVRYFECRKTWSHAGIELVSVDRGRGVNPAGDRGDTWHVPPKKKNLEQGDGNTSCPSPKYGAYML